MPITIWVRRLPVVIGMALLVLPWSLVALNWTAEWINPDHPAIHEHPLFGVQPPVSRPMLDGAGLWSGSYQRSFTRYFDQNLPMLATAVGLKNQIYFSWLRQSGTPSVIVGKHLQLYEPVYSDEYCGRDIPVIMAAAQAWADRLAALQQWYETRGKVFIYVITPSKVATYPEILAVPCASPADRDTLLRAWDAVLDQHAIRYIDGATLVQHAKPHYPFAMFPRGGTHWNEVAAALATQAITRMINAAPTQWKLQDFEFTWQMARPVDVARDLTDLMNLPFPRLDYRVPVVSVVPSAMVTCRPVNVAAVGGSFTYGIAVLLEKLPCAPRIDFYDYLFITHASYPGDIRGEVDWTQRDHELFHHAEIVILEENEGQIIRSNHTTAFYDLMIDQPAAAAPSE